MINFKKKKNNSIIQMVLCAILWSIAGIFIKMVPWNPFVIAGWRSFIALIVVFVFMWKWRKAVRFTWHSVLNGSLMCATFFCFVGANKLTTAANAIVLQFTAPVFILLLSVVFLHQKFRRSDIVAVLCTLGGIAFFFFDQLKPGYLLGNCIALFSGLLMASIYVTTGHAKEDERIGGQIIGHLLTAIIGIAFMPFYETPVSFKAIVCLLVLGIFQLGIAYILLMMAVKYCPPLACCLIGAIEPLLNPVWVFIFNGEAPSFFALVGGVIVIVTVTVWCIWKDRHPVEEIKQMDVVELDNPIHFESAGADFPLKKNQKFKKNTTPGIIQFGKREKKNED